MIRFILLLFLLQTISSDDLQTGIRLFNDRAANTKGLQSDPTNINKAIAIFEKILDKDPLAEQAGFYYLQSLNYKGRFVATTEDEKKQVFSKAIKKGNELLRTYPKSGPIRFALITSVGLQAEISGALKSAEDGVVGQMLVQGKALINCDSMYFYGAGWKVLAILNYKTPYIPLVMTWPDKQYALALLQKSLKYFPTDISNNFYYAEALLANDRKTEAKIYFQLVTKLPTRKDLILEDEYLKNESRKYLAKM